VSERHKQDRWGKKGKVPDHVYLKEGGRRGGGEKKAKETAIARGHHTNSGTLSTTPIR